MILARTFCSDNFDPSSSECINYCLMRVFLTIRGTRYKCSDFFGLSLVNNVTNNFIENFGTYISSAPMMWYLNE